MNAESILAIAEIMYTVTMNSYMNKYKENVLATIFPLADLNDEEKSSVEVCG